MPGEDQPPFRERRDPENAPIRALRKGMDDLAEKVGSLEATVHGFPELLQKELNHYPSYRALFVALGFLITLGVFLLAQVRSVADEIRHKDDEVTKEQAANFKKFAEEWSWVREKVDGTESLKKQAEKPKRKKEKAP